MGNEEIKKANRKALPKFIVLCIAAALVGGVMGILLEQMELIQCQGILKW